MNKFRKKPVEIEAAKFDGSDDSVEWLLPQLNSGEIGRSTNKLFIKTLEGTMTANKGDYIIKGVKGEFYPCKPDIFELDYEKIDDTKQPYITVYMSITETNVFKDLMKSYIAMMEDERIPIGIRKEYYQKIDKLKEYQVDLAK